MKGHCLVETLVVFLFSKLPYTRGTGVEWAAPVAMYRRSSSRRLELIVRPNEESRHWRHGPGLVCGGPASALGLALLIKPFLLEGVKGEGGREDKATTTAVINNRPEEGTVGGP